MTQTSPPKVQKLKILCMHGFGTNKEFMKMQTQIISKDLEKLAEFIFVDAPYVIPKAMVTDPQVTSRLEAPPRSWLDFRKTHKTRADKEILESFDDVRRAIEKGSDSYDGVFGFSQGSITFMFILWFQQMKLINWEVLKNVKFYLNFSADSSRVSLRTMGGKRFEMPSLHFLSEEDFLFPKCILVPTIFKDPIIIFHTFGHRFPILGIKQKQKTRNFLLEHGYNIKRRRGIQEQSNL